MLLFGTVAGYRSALCAAACAVGMAACGGSGGSAALPAAGPGLPGLAQGPATGPSAPRSTSGSGTATVTLRIPAPVKAVAGRAPAFVSPASQGVAFVAYSAIATPPPTPTIVADISTGPGSVCSTPAPDGSRSCPLSFSAPVGYDIVAVTLYDRVPAGGVFPSGSAALATASLGVTIVASGLNTVSFTLGGIPAKLALVPGQIYAPSSPGPSILNVVAIDAAGSTILAPGDFPSPITLALSGPGAGAFSLTPAQITTPGSPVTLTYAGGIFTSATVTASTTGVANATALVLPAPTPTPSPTPSPSPTPTPTPVPLPSGDVFVASSGNDRILNYTAGATGDIAPTGGILGSIVFRGLASDSAGWYAATNQGSIVSFPLNASGVSPTREFTLSGNATGLCDPRALAVSGSYLYVGDACGKVIKLPKVGGNQTPAYVNLQGSTDPAAIAVDSSGNAYVADRANGVQILKVSANGATTSVAQPASQSNVTGGSSINGLVVDGLGNLVAAIGGNSVYTYGPPFTGLGSPFSSAVFSGLYAIAISPAKIFAVLPNGNVSALAYPGFASLGIATFGSGSRTFTSRSGIAIAPDGDIAVSSLPNASIQVYDLLCPGSEGCVLEATIGGSAPAGVSGPQGIAFDPSGNLYVVNASTAKVAMWLTPFPTIINQTPPTSEFATTCSTPRGIAYDVTSSALWISCATSLAKYSTAGSLISTTTISGANDYRQVATDTNGRVYVADAGAGTVVTLLANVGGTLLTAPGAVGVAIDASRNVYVSYLNAGVPTIGVYPPGSSTASRTIAGSATTMTAAGYLSLDITGNIVLSQPSSVLKFASNASGNTAPIATIAGPTNTLLSSPAGVAVRPAGVVLTGVRRR